MRMYKKITWLMVMAMLLSLLGGCTTPEKVMTKMVETMSTKTISQLSFNMPFAMEMNMAGESTAFDLELDGTVSISEEDKIAYVELEYKGDIMGSYISDTMEIYFTKEDDSYVMYLYSKTGDYWSYADLGVADELLGEEEFSMGFEDLTGFDSEALTMAEETQNIDGSEVYVVSYPFSGDFIAKEIEELGGFQSIMEQSMASSGLSGEDTAMMDAIDFSALDNLDFSVLQMPVTMYVDKESYELKQIDIEYIGMQSFMNQIMAVVFGMVGDMLGEAADLIDLEDQFSITMEDTKIVLSDFCYEPVTVKTVSEEGRILGKQASFEPLQADGSYVIQEYGNATRVVPLAGQDVIDYGYYYVDMSSADGVAMASYYMFDSTTTEADIYEIINEQEQAFIDQGFAVSKTDSAYGDYKVQIINIQGYGVVNAWRPVGNGTLYFVGYDFSTMDSQSVLQTLAAAVSDYTLP